MILIAVLFSCKKEETPVPKPEPGDVTSASVTMGSDYKYQTYFDLKTNSVVGVNLKTDWDLGFECSQNGFQVILNAAKSMYAYNTNISDFNSITDTIGFETNKKWDAPSGDMDSTAIGDWQTNTSVYIIDRGYNEIGTHQGFRKIQFLSVNELSYQIRFADLNGDNEKTMKIDKDDAYNFSFLSFSTQNTVMIEPPKETWDLVFTQFLHVFYEPELIIYLVTGCVLNRYQTSAIKDVNIDFSEITLDYAENKILKSEIDVIGYDWKTYTGGAYITNSEYNYIIKDSEGFYYKLHFIDFYSETGQKGTPVFEFQQL